MDAPKKIYLQVLGEEDDERADVWPDEGITWCQDRINNSDVEYIRSDLVKEEL